MSLDLPGGFAGVTLAAVVLFWALTILIHVCFAVAVARDAAQIEQAGPGALLVTRWVWALATLVGGVFVAAAYWIIHHSTLRRL